MDTRLSGTSEESNGEHPPRLSRTLPPLPRLPSEPSIKDVAFRDGTLAAFFYAQWPLLIDHLEEVGKAIKRVETRERASFVWPLVTGLSLAALAADFIPRALAHFGW